MPSRTHLALFVSGLVAIAATAVGVHLLTSPDCCDDNVGWVIGIPTVALGVGQLVAAVVGWQRSVRYPQAACTVWAGVLLLADGGVGGADNLVGIGLAVLAIGMGALSVWVTG